MMVACYAVPARQLSEESKHETSNPLTGEAYRPPIGPTGEGYRPPGPGCPQLPGQPPPGPAGLGPNRVRGGW